MTDKPDDTSNAEQDTADQVQEVVSYPSDRDWLLQDIVRLANLGLAMGITVSVEGMLVSGQLIGGKAYFDELAESFRTGTHSGVSEGFDLMGSLADGWAAHGQRYVRPEDAGEDWQPPEPGFIHLRNARMYAPGRPAIPENKGLLWRGKLNSISGFSMGSFDPLI